MLSRTLALTLLVVTATATAARAEDDITVRGRVVDADGKPVAGVEVADTWEGTRGGMTAYKGVRTGPDGTYALPVPGWKQETSVLALDAGRKRGGLVTLKPKESADAPAIALGPVVRVFGHFETKELGTRPPWTNVYVSTSKTARLLGSQSQKAEFGFTLPPGKYQFYGYGQDVDKVVREIEVPADKGELDLGAVDLPPSAIARHVGKAPPPWHVKEARGLKKDVTAADFKGKWVLLDFWGHWCGPCVHGLAELIDVYELHADHRDKFEIVAFHDSSVESLGEMDEKLTRIKAGIWRGRDLPFPILLDDARKTATAYGVQSWPTTVLIDPDGKLVGQVHGADALEAKLPKLPAAARVARALDRGVAVGVEGMTLTVAASFLGGQCRVPIKLDEPVLKSKGVDPKAVIPLDLRGMLSMRSWLNLFLTPDGLTYRPEGDGLLITVGPRPEDSPAQKATNAKITALLDKPLDFDLKDRPLAQVAKFFEDKTGENFVLDPAARRAGTLDPKATVSGSAKDLPLREGLQKLLEPLKLQAVVRDEVVIIEPRR